LTRRLTLGAGEVREYLSLRPNNAPPLSARQRWLRLLGRRSRPNSLGRKQSRKSASLPAIRPPIWSPWKSWLVVVQMTSECVFACARHKA
jgi:hypothetical protein